MLRDFSGNFLSDSSAGAVKRKRFFKFRLGQIHHRRVREVRVVRVVDIVGERLGGMPNSISDIPSWEHIPNTASLASLAISPLLRAEQFGEKRPRGFRDVHERPDVRFVRLIYPCLLL